MVPVRPLNSKYNWKSSDNLVPKEELFYFQPTNKKIVVSRQISQSHKEFVNENEASIARSSIINSNNQLKNGKSSFHDYFTNNEEQDETNSKSTINESNIKTVSIINKNLTNNNNNKLKEKSKPNLDHHNQTKIIYDNSYSGVESSECESFI